MAEAKVGVIIEAEDRASAVLAGVNSRMDTLQGKVKSMQPTFQKMALIGTAAFAGISAAVYSSVEAANEAQLVQAQLGAVLKSTAGIAGVTAEAALKLSKALQAETTFGDEAILSAENLLLTFTKIGKDIFPEATKTVLNMSTALGQDTKNSAIQLGKALNDPIRGITALRKVGVAFTQQQEDQIKVLVESGKSLEAQKIILQELATEFGGSASAKAETFAGKILQMKERLNDVQEVIGNAFIPILTSLVAKIQPVVEKVMAWVEANPKLIVKIVEVGLAVAGFTAIVGLLGMALIPLTAAVTFLLSPFGLIFIAVTAVVGLFVFFHDRIKEIFATIDEKTGLITMMKDAWDNIVATFNNFLVPALKDLWLHLEPLKPFLEAMAQVVGFTLVVAIGGLIKIVEGWIGVFTLLITGLTQVVDFLTKIFVGTIDFVTKTVEKAASAIEKMINALNRLNVVKSAKSFIGNVIGGAQSVLGINDGIVQNGRVITTHPDDYIIATKTPASLGGGKNINIFIQGAVLTQEAARTIGDLIISELRLNMKY